MSVNALFKQLQRLADAGVRGAAALEEIAKELKTLNAKKAEGCKCDEGPSQCCPVHGTQARGPSDCHVCRSGAYCPTHGDLPPPRGPSPFPIKIR